MEKKVNANMITLAREARGLTQEELSMQSDIDQATLSRMEKGLHLVSESHLEKISSALKFPTGFFLLDNSFSRLSDFFYRKRVTMRAKEKNKLEAEIDIIRIIFDRFTSAIELPDAHIPNMMAQVGLTPEDIAIMAREFFKIPRGPLKNLISLLEKNGISVIMLSNVPEKFDGITVFTEKNHPLIILNKDMPNDRKRFTLAHELGHEIMHLPFKYQPKIYEGLKEGSDVFDKEADRFASEFLMPTKDIISDLQDLSYKDLGTLKMYWQVSKKAIIYKAKALGCIDAKRAQNLLIELSRNGERIKESVQIDIDESKIIKQLFAVHRNNLSYSTHELSQALCISEEDVLKLEANHYPRRLQIVV